MNRRSIVTIVVSALLLAGAAFPAAADRGMIINSGQLPAAAASALREQVETARQESPAIFEAVRRIVEDAPRLAAQAHNRRAMLTPEFRAAGGEALFALLEFIAFTAPDRKLFDEGQWLDTQVCLIEAAGMLRDPRALPVFRAVAADVNQPAEITRFASESLGRLGSDEAVAELKALLSNTRGERRLAVLAGMGQCRRAPIARVLAAELARGTDRETVRTVIDSLRDVGNAWAWETPVVAANGEGSLTRRIAAEALTAAFVTQSGAERESAAKALLVVDAPETMALLKRERGRAGPTLVVELDRLIERLENSPLRR